MSPAPIVVDMGLYRPDMGLCKPLDCLKLLSEIESPAQIEGFRWGTHIYELCLDTAPADINVSYEDPYDIDVNYADEMASEYAYVPYLDIAKVYDALASAKPDPMVLEHIKPTKARKPRDRRNEARVKKILVQLSRTSDNAALCTVVQNIGLTPLTPSGTIKRI